MWSQWTNCSFIVCVFHIFLTAVTSISCLEWLKLTVCRWIWDCWGHDAPVRHADWLEKPIRVKPAPLFHPSFQLSASSREIGRQHGSPVPSLPFSFHNPLGAALMDHETTTSSSNPTVSLSGVRTPCFWRPSGLGKGVTLLAHRCRCCCWPHGVHSQKHRCSRSCAGTSQSSPRVLKVKLNHLHQHGGGVSHQFICRKLISSNSTFKIRAWGFSRDFVLPRWMKVNPGSPQREVCEFQTVLQL